MEVGTGGVERCRGKPGPCVSGSGGWPSTGHGPGPLGPEPGGPHLGVLLGGLLDAWRPGLGVWNVVGGSLDRVCLGLGAGQVRVTVLVSWGLDLGALCGSGAMESDGGMEVGTGGVECCRRRPGPCVSGSGGWPVRVPVLVPWGLDLGALIWGCCWGVCWRHGGQDWGCGTFWGRPGPCVSGSGGWPSTGHGPGLLGPGPGGPAWTWCWGVFWRHGGRGWGCGTL